MPAFFAALAQAFIKTLPAVLARFLLLLVLMGAAALHLWAVSRISVLERTDIEVAAQNVHVLAAVKDLTEEVRGYRDDMRAENMANRLERDAARQESRANRQEDRADRAKVVTAAAAAAAAAAQAARR